MLWADSACSGTYHIFIDASKMADGAGSGIYYNRIFQTVFLAVRKSAAKKL